jgi:GMP synthase (glutamine-hydrolysing)
MGLPVLGICYGMQWITHALGGKVEKAERREYGRAQLKVRAGSGANPSELFAGVPESLRIWNSHGDNVREVPPGFHATGHTDNAIASLEDPQRKIYAVQFHVEVNHTERGTELLRNFLFRVCQAETKWSGSAFIEETTEAIRTKVGHNRAICALSGGVDSTVAAVLVHRAMGDRLTNIFVDTGMLRKNEFADTLEMLRNRLGLRVIGVDAAGRFLDKLVGVTDPEQKRKIIGREFIAVFAEEAQSCSAAKLGAISSSSGTLYPDVIESCPSRGPLPP